VLNGLAHYSWCHDHFSGATDIVYGRLTGLGWWHLGFSTLQMTIIFLVIGVWIATLKSNSEQTHRLFYRAWLVLVTFSFLPLFDVSIKCLRAYNGLPVTDVIGLERMAVLPLLFAVPTFAVLQLLRRNTRQRVGRLGLGLQ